MSACDSLLRSQKAAMPCAFPRVPSLGMTRALASRCRVFAWECCAALSLPPGDVRGWGPSFEVPTSGMMRLGCLTMFTAHPDHVVGMPQFTARKAAARSGAQLGVGSDIIRGLTSSLFSRVEQLLKRQISGHGSCAAVGATRAAGCGQHGRACSRWPGAGCGPNCTVCAGP